MITIPVLPEMLDSIEEDPSISGRYDLESIENFISGLFIGFQSLGEATGPITSSILTDSFGFQTSQEIYTFFLIVYAALYFTTCGNFSMFTSVRIIDEQEVKMIKKQEKQRLMAKKGDSNIE